MKHSIITRRIFNTAAITSCMPINTFPITSLPRSFTSLPTRVASSPFLLTHRHALTPAHTLMFSRSFSKKFGDEQSTNKDDRSSGSSSNNNNTNNNSNAKNEKEQSSEFEEGQEQEGHAALGLVLIVAIVGGVLYFFFGPEKEHPDETFFQSCRSFWDTYVLGVAPLIPEQQLDQYGRKQRVLVVNYDKVLVNMQWNRADGWRVAKRPFVDRFLERAARAGFEIVLFASSPSYEIDQNLQELDPTGTIKHKLFSENTNFKGLHLCKSLRRLTRDPERTVVVDFTARNYCEQSENVLLIPEFTLEPHDRELSKVILFLENIQRYNIHDVRPLISEYNRDSTRNLFEHEEEMAREAKKKLKVYQPLQHAQQTDTVKDNASSAGGSWISKIGSLFSSAAKNTVPGTVKTLKDVDDI